EIISIRTDGSAPANITNNSATEWIGAWSPTGEEILFQSGRDEATYEVYRMAGNGSDVQRLTFNSDGDYVTDWRSSPIQPKVPFDFDGDGKTDVSIFRPAGGEWWY